MSTKDPRPSWSTEELLAERAWLRALAGRLVRGETERDDLVQEAWVAALRWPVARSTNLRLWLGGVLRNRWRFERRTAERRVQRERTATRAASSPSAAELAERAELQRLLVGAVLALAEPYRSTVLRRYFGGLSSRAIARQEDVPEGTVRGRLKRALDQLRAELDRHHGGDRERWVLALVPLAREGAVTGTAAAVGACLALVLGGATAWWAIAGPGRADDPELARAAEPVALEAPVPAAAMERVTGPAPEIPAIQGSSDVGPARQSVEPSSAGSHEAGTIVRVLDPEDAPIAGATVTWWLGEEERTERTDHEGRAVLPVEREGGIELLVEAAGFFPDRAKRGGEGLTVHLLRVTELAGRVLDAAAGTPIAESRVRSAGVEARSDPSGRFRLEGVPVGEEFWIECEAPGYPVQGRSILLRSADPEPLELSIEQGLALSGRVLDLVTREPIAEALLEDAGQGHELTRTGLDGSFDTRVSPVPGYGFADVRVTAPGYCGVRLAFRGITERGLDVSLVRTATIEGVVRDQHGRPVNQARIWLQGTSEFHVRDVAAAFGAESPYRALEREWRLTWDDPRTSSDEEGRFRLEGAPPWQPRITVWADIGPETTAGKAVFERMPDPGETVAVELAMRVPEDDDVAPGRIGGTLRLNGEPLRGRVSWESGEARGEASSERDGTFRLENVAPGSVVLRVGRHYSSRLWSPAFEREQRTVEVTAGDTANVDFDLVLEMSAIRGRVRLPSGAPAQDKDVFARDTGDPLVRVATRTNADGEYELRVPAGDRTYDVMSSHGPDVAVRRSVPSSAQGIDLELVPFGRVRLRARAESTGRAVEALWSRRRPGSEWSEISGAGDHAADSEGFIEVDLQTGRWELACGSPELGHPIQLGPVVHVGEDELSTVDLTLARGIDVELALDPARDAPDHVRIEALDAQAFAPLGALERWFRRIVQVEGSGRALVRGLVPGPHRLVSLGGDLRFEPASILASAANTEPVTVRWIQGQ